MKSLIFIVLLFASLACKADVAFGPYQAWWFVDNHSLILQGVSGRYFVKTNFCYITRGSSIGGISNQLMPYSGIIIIDGNSCMVNEVTRM